MDTNLQLDKELWELAKTIDVKAKPVERYAGLAFLDSFKIAKVGIDPCLSGNDLHVLRERMADQLDKYARWITIDFYPHEQGVSFYTNFNLVFKTAKGTLYGHPEGPLRSLFYTAHSLERFIKRTDEQQYKVITETYLKKYGRRATPHEILDEILLSDLTSLEFGITNGIDIYLNTKIGVLVLESRKDCYVAKTFINTNYAQRNALWYKSNNVEGYFMDDYDIKHLLNGHSEPCDPLFVKEL